MSNPMTESKDFDEAAPQAQPRLSTADLAGAASTAETRRPDEERTILQPVQSDGAASKAVEPNSATPLFSPGETDKLRARWNDIQGGFVDEPREAVEHADELVALTIKRLAEVFSDERGKMEGQWDRGGDVSTEDLRLALRRYRSFFDRLLSV
jgi:hypothetical protein